MAMIQLLQRDDPVYDGLTISIRVSSYVSGNDNSKAVYCPGYDPSRKETPTNNWVLMCMTDPPNSGDGVEYTRNSRGNNGCRAFSSGSSIRAVAVCSNMRTSAVQSGPYEYLFPPPKRTGYALLEGTVEVTCNNGRRPYACLCRSPWGMKYCEGSSLFAPDVDNRKCTRQVPKDIAHRRRRIFGGPEADDSEGAYVFGICIGQNEEVDYREANTKSGDDAISSKTCDGTDEALLCTSQPLHRGDGVTIGQKSGSDTPNSCRTHSSKQQSLAASSLCAPPNSKLRLVTSPGDGKYVEESGKWFYGASGYVPISCNCHSYWGANKWCQAQTTYYPFFYDEGGVRGLRCAYKGQGRRRRRGVGRRRGLGFGAFYSAITARLGSPCNELTKVCAAPACELWQFKKDYGCFRGSSNQCLRTVDPFCDGSRGERLRGRVGGTLGVVWFGSRWHNYVEIAPVDPYRHGAQKEVLQTFEGEFVHFSRSGPGVHQMNVSKSCWSYDRHPSWCCPGIAQQVRACWPAHSISSHCCSQGQSAEGSILYNAFFAATPHLPAEEVQQFHENFPGFAIDEASFEDTRLRFRLGDKSPSLICPSGSIEQTMDSSGVLWQMALLLAYFRAPASGTFLNLGSGTCQAPDPLHQLLSSAEGDGMVGIAVDSNSSRLDVCRATMSNTPARVLPVHLTLDPTQVVEQLLPYLKLIFGGARKPWPLDFLVVDLDGVDCLVIEELLRVLRPKVIHLEIITHIPPPFRFSLQWHSRLSPHWNDVYDVDLLNPFQGCSLSYALHKFRPFGYALQRDALNEEKTRLQAELQESMKQLKELKPQVASLSTQLEEAIASRAELETQVESNRQRAERSEELCAKLEALVAEKEAEIERLRKGLADQQKLTQEVCEAADRRDQQANEQNAAEVRDLQETIRKLKMENQQLLQEQQLQAKRQEEMGHSVAVAMAAAEKAMAMHAQHTSQLETLRTAKLAEAINSKVELHIAVPKVTLTYNNAPPLLVSVAAGLGEGKLETFLNKEVFPHFEPLWVRLDGLDKAPDGSSKKAYSSRMLDRLTQAVKTFLVRSQTEGDG
ncbi:unnamed protein product, partial [Symbiodinium sp. KB8]